MKELFDKLEAIRSKLNSMEDELQAFRDQVGTPIKPSINDSIRAAQALRDMLWKVDKALENQNEDAKSAANLLKDLEKGNAS